MKKLSDFEKTAEVKLRADAVVEAFRLELDALVTKYTGFEGLQESEKAMVVNAIGKTLYKASTGE